RVHLVYLGVDQPQHGIVSATERALTRSRLGLTSADIVLLFLGALGHDRRKGFDTLLGALGRLKPLFPRVKIVAAGKGAIAFWQAKINTAGFDESVRLLGHVQDTPGLVAAAD